MKLVVKRIRWLVIIALSLGIIACSSKADAVNVTTPEAALVGTVSLDVYKSPTCDYCENWVSHVGAAGYDTALHHPTSLNKLKKDKGVLSPYQSFHIAVTQTGYVFEGHIPADVIKRFVANSPADVIKRFVANSPADALGLTVPDMHVGSPGMEMVNRHDEYDLLLLSRDGSSTVFEYIAGRH